MPEKNSNKSKTNAKPKKAKSAKSTAGRSGAGKSAAGGNSAAIACICLAAVCLIVMICMYSDKAGYLGSAVSSFLRGLLGMGAYAAPIMAVAMILHYAFGKSENKRLKYILSWCALADFSALCHMMVPKSVQWSEYYSYSCTHAGGGLIGALISEPLIALMERVCTYVVLYTVMAVLLIIIFNISPAQVAKKIAAYAKQTFAGIKSKDAETESEPPNKKAHTAPESDEIPLPEPPPERYERIPEPPADMQPPAEPEINIYNDTEGKEEKISDSEKRSLHNEIQNEVDSNTDSEKFEYHYPTVDLLTAPKANDNSKKMNDELRENAVKLVETLRSFHVEAQVVEISCGPTVTRYEVKPAPGVKVSQITGLSKDIALKLAARGGVMIAPVPGKSTIGIEIANAHPSVVTLREVLDSSEFKNHKSKLAVALGKDISGAPVIMDIAKMPHLLIAGATGAGKSVCINTLVISLLYKADPSEVKLVMIDPKQVELGVYNGIPHLLIPVVKDAHKATAALSWAVQEMTERYSTFERNNVRNIQGYNELMEAEGTPENKMPSIVIIIDEFADLMMVAPGDVENYVCRIAQLARAAGMHLVIATQRPVVKFITGNIKANVPSRISFMVASVKDSQTILDMGGAEKLVGKGDMLYMPVGETKPERMQCAFVSDSDVKKVVEEVTKGCEPTYDADVIEHLESDDEYNPDGPDAGDADELLKDAIELAVDCEQISTSMLQRRFRIGYNRAGSIIDQMEARGIISAPDGNRPRKVLITRDQYNEMLLK